MSRLSSGALIAGVALDPGLPQSLYAQLYRALRRLVMSQQLEPGARMPSSRSFAIDLGVSRSTVAQAYEQLKSEGYLSGHEKSGTFVATVLPESLAWRRPTTTLSEPIGNPEPAKLAERMCGTVPAKPELGTTAMPFHPGIPAVAAFPSKRFATLQKQVSLELVRRGAARCPAEGAMALREQVSTYLMASRGVVCHPRQVFIISGTHQALHLVLLCLSNPGDAAWAENPGYPGAPKAYGLLGLHTVAVPVDAEGLVVAEGRRQAEHARFAYVTPARQAPSGHTMSLNRRLELLRWAHERDAFVLEDDYDGEYRFGGAPPPSLQSLDPNGRVIYFGTFSKTLLPSLGIGYLVVPERLIDVTSRAIALVARPPDLSMQLTIARYIESGGFESHVRQMRSLYKRRQNLLSRRMAAALDGVLEVEVLNAGLHLIGHLPAGLHDRRVADLAYMRGLLPRPLSDFVISGAHAPALMLGFANMTEEQMEPAITALREAIDEAIREVDRGMLAYVRSGDAAGAPVADCGSASASL